MRERFEGLLKLLQRSERHVPGPITHMFIEDVHASVMPFRTQKGNRQIEAVFEGDTNDVTVALRTCQHVGRHSSGHEEATEIVCDAVREIVQHMLWRGYAAFEIAEKPTHVPISPSRSHYTVEDFDEYYPLHSLSSDHVFRVPGVVLSLRRRERAHWDRGRAFFKAHRSGRVWFVKMPSVLGGRTGYRRVIRKLERIRETFPRWTAEALVKEQQVRFDVSEYGRLRAAYYARSTSGWSWNGRDTSLNYQTEFFLFYRTVTFRYALAVLREHVVDSLNRLFRRQLRLNARIVLKGFASPEEVLAIRGRMERAELSIGDAFDLVTF